MIDHGLRKLSFLQKFLKKSQFSKGARQRVHAMVYCDRIRLSFECAQYLWCSLNSFYLSRFPFLIILGFSHLYFDYQIQNKKDPIHILFQKTFPATPKTFWEIKNRLKSRNWPELALKIVIKNPEIVKKALNTEIDLIKTLDKIE